MVESDQLRSGEDARDHPVHAVGRRLEVVRKRRGWTYREMSAKSGVPVNTLHRWLQRRRRAWEYFELRGLVERLGEVWDREWEGLWRRAAEADPLRRPLAAEPPSPLVVPFQVPADTAHFTGRAAELNSLLDLWPSDGSVPATVVVSAVEGMAGIGKTALVVHAAHRLAERFPDGVLFTDLHGFTADADPCPPETALDHLLRGLGVPGSQIPRDLDARAALYRSILARRRVLVVLDNAAGEDQVAPLLPGAPGSLVMITSRRRLTALDEAVPISLETLPPADAVELLTAIARPHAAPPDVLREIVGLCGHLPLAIRIAAARLRHHRAWTPRHLADLLADQHRRLAQLDDGTRSVTAALTVSYRHLTSEQQHAYALIGLHPGLDLDIHALAALADTPVDRAQQLLDDLEQVNLLDQPSSRRYTLHDLVRTHAARVAAEDTETNRHAALARLFDYYACTASEAMETVYPYRIDEYSRSPRTGGLFDSPQQAEAWLDTELDNLLTCAVQAAGHGRPDHTAHQSTTLNAHLHVRARYASAQALHEYALTATHTTADPGAELTALNALGDIHRMQGRLVQAADHYQQALDIARRTEDPIGELNALHGLGWIHYLQGRAVQAADSLGQALKIARQIGHRAGELNALNGLASMHRMQGRYEQAADNFGQALDIARQISHRTGHMTAVHGLGDIHWLEGRHEQAADSFGQALEIAHRLGHRSGELSALTGLGWVHLSQGRYEQAADNFGQALETARQISHRTGELNALTGLGLLHRRQGRYELATDDYERVLQIADEIGDPNWQFEALYGLGRIYESTDHPAAALTHHQRALGIATELDQPSDQARAHDGLAHANLALGRHAHARHHWQTALATLTGLGIDRTEDGVTTADLSAHLTNLDLNPA